MDIYQCLKLVYSDRLSSFFTKLSKNNMGASQGMSDAPCDAPIMGVSGGVGHPHDVPMLFLTVD